MTPRWFLVLAAVLAMAGPMRAAPTVARDDQAVSIVLDNGVALRFAVRDGLLLGLQSATVASQALKSDQTVQRPVLAQEFGADRMIWPYMRLREVKVVQGAVQLHADLLGVTDERAYRAFFVFAGDEKKALAEGITPELRAQVPLFNAADARIIAAIDQLPDMQPVLKELAEAQAAAANADAKTRDRANKNVTRAMARVEASRVKLRGAVAASSEELVAAQKIVDQYRAMLATRAMEVGDIHRDFYRFAHVQQPEQICDIAQLQRDAAALRDQLKPAGTIIWTIEPDQRTIAGWTWTGWRQHYTFALDAGRKVNVLRQVGTLELDGSAAGLTPVNLRYRGLGRIEQPLTAGDDHATIREAFTTTEIMAGAVDGAYMISPIVPPSAQVNDRGYALRHRAGAWISKPARGAGVQFFDFQFRPAAGLLTFHDRQGNLRALTEAFPGDRCLSHTDEEWFANTDRFQTQPQTYLALVVRDSPLQIHEWRTRWKEVEHHVRDLVSAELGFVQHDALPGVGILSDNGWAGYYKGLAAGGLDQWGEAGVRMVAYHNPGWSNGRYRGPKDDPDTVPYTGGGVCNIYDWWPTKDVVQPWKDAQASAAKNGIAMLPWIGQTQNCQAPFAKRVGDLKTHWTLNTPLDDCGPGYAPDVKGNILDPAFRNTFVGQLDKLRRELGYQGFWFDSFQNLFMSQLTWADGSGTSVQRGWWEQLARWSREGVVIMAESQAFPGLSCSLETQHWEQDFWYFGHVWKWLRGSSQQEYSSQAIDQLTFRLMANKGWLAPDHSNKTDARFHTPGFRRLAHEYLAALPGMHRPFILPDDAGILWLSRDSDAQGLYFPFSTPLLPGDVAASAVLDQAASPQLQPFHAYRVQSPDLLKSFNLRRAPAMDDRMASTVAPVPPFPRPDWISSPPAKN